MEIEGMIKITRHCTGVCDGKDCPYYKHSSPAWCLAMNIKEMQDTMDGQKAEIEALSEINSDLNESLRLAAEANKDMAAKLKRARWEK